MANSPVSVGQRIRDLAKTHPEDTAAVLVSHRGTERHVTWQELETSSNVAALTFSELGVTPGKMVAIALPTCVEHLFGTIGAWKCGATVLPLDPRLRPTERVAIMTQIDPTVVVEVTDRTRSVHSTSISPDDLFARQSPSARDTDTVPISEVARSASATGGTTGTPRILVQNQPW